MTTEAEAALTVLEWRILHALRARAPHGRREPTVATRAGVSRSRLESCSSVWAVRS
jgi:hypothetical protein